MAEGILKLGEGQWGVKDGNLLLDKEVAGNHLKREFTVTRGTDATYVGKDGLIKTTPSFYNLIPYSENFDDTTSDWLNVNVSVELNSAISPQGISNAAKITEGTVDDEFRIQYIFPQTINTNYSYSIFVKANGRNYCGINIGASRLFANFDLINGTVTRVSSNGTDFNNESASINAFGNGWYKCTLSGYALTTNGSYIRFALRNIESTSSSLNYLGDGTSGAYIWGAQLVEGTEALDYQYTNGKEGIPRIDFTDNTDGHLLLEPESRNLVPYSENFEGGSWQNASIGTIPTLDGGYTAPDGTNTAYKISNANQDSFWYYPSVADSDYARTIWARTVSGTGTAQLLSHNSNTNNTFTLTETWQRFKINSTTSSTGETGFYAVDFRGSGTLDEVLVWGAQSEELPYATSYIPTNGSTVTRDGETCTGAGEAQDFNSEEGVLYAEIADITNDNLSDNNILAIAKSTDEEFRVHIAFKTNGTIQGLIREGSANTKLDVSTTSVLPSSSFFKVAVLFESGNNKLYVNGSQIGSTNTNTFSNLQLNSLQFNRGDDNKIFYGKCKAIRVYKEALSDSELTTLTSL